MPKWYANFIFRLRYDTSGDNLRILSIYISNINPFKRHIDIAHDDIIIVN